MFYERILVAFDGSELSEKALGKAVQMAESNKSIALDVVMVLNNNPAIPGVYPMTTPNFYDSDLQYGEETIKRLKKELSGLENPHTVSLLEGKPESKILEFAKGRGTDLIIMGSRGLNGLKELFLGSVSHYVVQHSKVPVLIVK
ncbi:universal stress protein [Paenibacillus aurantius]|uniref:Universal stress protein n=1 Tax=Paenibacillus aurantius TaxID=2918900 RepID=A0AA96LCP1_9BACL|nr:universal stress protein [Paenibacillus aurantius]WNQ11302.1 universal stress protein [Paenibacillus aurantius]